MPERKIEYSPLQNKAQTGFSVKAPSLQRLYIDAGLALADSLVQLDLVRDSDRRTITVTGESKEVLMKNWLNEMLRLYTADKYLAKRIVFNTFDGKRIEAVLYGETYVSTRHGYVTDIKTIELPKLGDSPSPEPHFFAQISLKS